MKLRSIFNKIFLIILLVGSSSFSASAFTIQKMSEWPNLPDDAVSADDNYVFHGLGTTLRIFDKNLNSEKNFDINSLYAIQDVLADNQNKILYVAAGKSGVFIYNYSDINNIEYYGVIENIADDPGFLIGEQRSSIDAASLALDENYLYIADNGYGFRIINVSNPQAPAYEGGYRQDGQSEELTTGGYFDVEFFSFDSKDYIAVLDLYYGLKIFDVTDPASYDNPVAVKNALVSPDSLIVNPPPDTQEEIDAVMESENDPEPVSKRDLRTAYYNTITLARDLKVKEINSNIYIFITSRSETEEKAAVAKLQVFDDSGSFIKDPDDPQENRPRNIGRNDELLKGNSVETNGYHAFIADGKEGLQIVDITNKTGETSTGVEIYGTKYSLKTGYTNSYSLKLQDNSIFMSDLTKGLSKIDVTDESNPSESSSTGSFYSFTDMAANDNILCTVNSEAEKPGFLFFDASDTLEPEIIKKVNEDSPLFIKKFSDSFASVTDTKIILFKNIKTSPAIAYSYDITNGKTPLSLEVYGSYIYIGTDTGLDIYKYESSKIDFIKTFDNTKKFQSLFFDAESKTLFTGSAGILGSLGISDPENPFNTGLTFDCTNEIKAIYCENSALFAASGNSVFTLNKNSLTQINAIDAKTIVNTVSADEEFLFAGTSEGIKLYSGANETSPKFLSTHSTKGNVSKTILSGSHVFSADSTGGISISKYDKTAGSDDTSPPSSGGGSSCFINSLF